MYLSSITNIQNCKRLFNQIYLLEINVFQHLPNIKDDVLKNIY